MTNLDKFIAEYEKQLTLAVQNYPAEFGYPVSYVPTVIGRMKNAIINQTYNKDGRGIKNTCKALGIKYTYQAINDYVKA
jgi:hypothetical protein